MNHIRDGNRASEPDNQHTALTFGKSHTRFGDTGLPVTALPLDQSCLSTLGKLRLCSPLLAVEFEDEDDIALSVSLVVGESGNPCGPR